MVTIHPFRAIISRRVGMAVISLLFSSVFTWARIGFIPFDSWVLDMPEKVD
jgi:hypothetical protein